MHGSRENTSFRKISLVLPRFALIVVICNAHATSIPGQGDWETTLQGRDIEGHALQATDERSVFLYDTSLNITWLKNGNLNGPMTWVAAMDWTSGLKVGTFSGWRLPSALIPDASCTLANAYPAVYSQGYGMGCSGSEMGHLFNLTLRNLNGPITNGGDFQSFQNYYYWTNTPLAGNPYYVWTYNLAINGQAYTGMGTNGFFAMAVRDGDILVSVPEPASGILAVAGLFFLAIRWRTQQRS